MKSKSQQSKIADLPAVPMRPITTVTNSSREHNRLRIHRSTISTNSFPTKYALHIDPPRFVESDTPSLHDDIHIPLGVLIQSSSRIARFDVLCQIEVGAMKTCFGIAGKVGGDARVANRFRRRYRVLMRVRNIWVLMVFVVELMGSDAADLVRLGPLLRD